MGFRYTRRKFSTSPEVPRYLNPRQVRSGILHVLETSLSSMDPEYTLASALEKGGLSGLPRSREEMLTFLEGPLKETIFSLEANAWIRGDVAIRVESIAALLPPAASQSGVRAVCPIVFVHAPRILGTKLDAAVGSTACVIAFPTFAEMREHASRVPPAIIVAETKYSVNENSDTLRMELGDAISESNIDLVAAMIRARLGC